MENKKNIILITVIITLLSLVFLNRNDYKPSTVKVNETKTEVYPNEEVSEEIIVDDFKQEVDRYITREKVVISENATVVLYAKKNKKTVEVQIRKDGNLVLNFKYEEFFASDDTGNKWTGLKPSIDLSPDGKKVVYADKAGLKILDFSTNDFNFFKNNIIPEDDMRASVFVDPEWFPNSRYILYKQPLYEGSKSGIIDYVSGEYNDSVLTLSPSLLKTIISGGKTYILYSTSKDNDIYGRDPGLYIAEVVSLKNIKFKQLIEDNTEIDVRDFSYDSSKNLITFEYYKDYYNKDETKYVGTISLDSILF